MGRPKEFCTEAALDQAMETFWRKGFKATSIQDLVEAMGINRGSLYDTYGGKEQLFQAALDRYCERNIAGLLEALDAPGAPREVVRQFLLHVVDGCEGDTGKRGCLLTNSVVELAPHCDATQAKVSESLARIEDGFFRLIERSEKDGNKARALARFLVGNLQGLSVVSKTTPTRPALEDVVDVIVSVIP